MVSTGGNHRCSGRVPQWVERLLQKGAWDSGSDEESIQDAADSPMDPVSDQESVEDTGGVEPPPSAQVDDQPEVTAAPRYSFQNHSRLKPPNKTALVVARDELHPGRSDVTL